MNMRTIKTGMSSIAVFLLALGMAASAPAQQGQQQVPDAYYQLMGRANYAFQNATSTADYAAAVKLFQQAAEEAPWLPDTYYNLGKAQEKAKQFNDAIRSLQQYLDLKPNAADRDKVHAEIEEIQGEAQQASEQPSAEQKEQQTALEEEEEKLVGKWFYFYAGGYSKGQAFLVISHNGRDYSASVIPNPLIVSGYGGTTSYQFTVTSFEVTGTGVKFTVNIQSTFPPNVAGLSSTIDNYDLSLSADGNELKGIHEQVSATTNGTNATYDFHITQKWTMARAE